MNLLKWYSFDFFNGLTLDVICKQIHKYIDAYLDPPRVSNFSPQVCFWWFVGAQISGPWRIQASHIVLLCQPIVHHCPSTSITDIKQLDVSENSGTPQIIHFERVFHYKPSILGYHYFWKHPICEKKTRCNWESFVPRRPGRATLKGPLHPEVAIGGNNTNYAQGVMVIEMR